MSWRDIKQLRDAVCRVIVFGPEDCSPGGKVENREHVVTKEDGDLLGVLHHCDVEHRPVFEVDGNLQVYLLGVIHHVHIRRVRPRELQAKHPMRLLAEHKYAPRFSTATACSCLVLG